MDDIIQLKITLNDSNPPIWRRVLVEKSSTFLKLHHIIQDTMGWTNTHLHEFDINGKSISERSEMSEDDDIDASTVTLESLIKKPKEKFIYSYDFGDDWEHQILVEKFLPRDAKIKYPTCIDGELNCPPEDCGGVWGFENILEIIKNKKHPEYEDTLDWIGEDYDPAYFDKKEINAALSLLNKNLK